MSDKKFNVQLDCDLTPQEALTELSDLLSTKQFGLDDSALIVILLNKVSQAFVQPQVSTMDANPGDVPPPPPIKP